MVARLISETVPWWADGLAGACIPTNRDRIWSKTENFIASVFRQSVLLRVKLDLFDRCSVVNIA